MASGKAYAVFVVPAALSLLLGGAVLGAVLQEPGRSLDLGVELPVPGAGDAPARFLGLEPEYEAPGPVTVWVTVSDEAFDCGDLYVTVHRLDTGETVTQNGFFDQCFVAAGSALPVGGSFSASIDAPGEYEIRASVNDRSQENTVTVSGEFSVK